MSQLEDDNNPETQLSEEDCAHRCEEGESLLSLCDEVVALLEMLKSENGPINQAEAAALPPEKMEQARELQCEYVERVFCLTEVIPKRRAQTEPELAAKRRAFQELSLEQTWDIRSLRAFRESIDQDVEYLTSMRIGSLPVARARRSNWLSRLGSFVG
jgi:hypothetical protein